VNPRTTQIEYVHGKPHALIHSGKRAVIMRQSGRWSLGGRWWLGESETRYYRVQCAGGGVADLQFSPATGQWRVDHWHG
jgi:hypothetical protein